MAMSEEQKADYQKALELVSKYDSISGPTKDILQLIQGIAEAIRNARRDGYMGGLLDAPKVQNKTIEHDPIEDIWKDLDQQ